MSIKKTFHKLFHSENMDLTKGSAIKGIILFALPIFLGQMLQSCYNIADAWVVGNFAGNKEFAAVSAATNMSFMVIGFCMGLAMGGGVVISRYLGARDWDKLRESIHGLFLLGLIFSVVFTIASLLLMPTLLRWFNIPAEVLPYSYQYFYIYFCGVSTVIMFNMCMSILRAIGDSLHPLYYLLMSCILNILLDIVFVAGFHWGVAGAASATIIAQGLSTVLCIWQMLHDKDEHSRLEIKQLHWQPDMIWQLVKQGFPAGIQNTVISIGNMVIQANICSFGAGAMSGHGAVTRVESLTFLPVMAMSQTIPTFVSQNLGAGKIKRAQKGSVFGILTGMAMAAAFGIYMYLNAEALVRFFIDDPSAVEFGVIHAHIAPLFYGLLAFSHCAAGTLRGCGRSMVPMVVMLLFWCCVRVSYVTLAVRIWPWFGTVSWAYPLTWNCSTIVFLIYLFRMDWHKAAESL